jgi:hypothetical protein
VKPTGFLGPSRPGSYRLGRPGPSGRADRGFLAEPTGTLPAEPTGALRAEPTGTFSAEPTETVPAEPTGTLSAEPTETVPAEPTGTLSAEPTETVPAEPTGTLSAEPTGALSRAGKAPRVVRVWAGQPSAEIVAYIRQSSNSGINQTTDADATAGPDT